MGSTRTAGVAATSTGVDRSERITRLARHLSEAVLLLACFVGSPSAAAITGYEVVSETRAADDATSKSALVECPDGKFVLGGGVHTFSAATPTPYTPATIWLNAPQLGPGVATSWNGGAHCDCPGAPSWGLRVDVICGDATGLEQVTATGPVNTNDSRFTQAICTAGNIAIGGGAQTLGAVESTALLESVESTAGGFGLEPGWAASARGPAASNWNVRAIALCADASTNVIATASTSSATITGPDLSHATACPEGMIAISGEAQAVAVDNATATDDARLTVFGPDGPIEAPTGWVATARRPATNTAEWRLTVGVICVPEPAGGASGSAVLIALALLARSGAAGVGGRVVRGGPPPGPGSDGRDASNGPRSLRLPPSIAMADGSPATGGAGRHAFRRVCTKVRGSESAGPDGPRRETR